MNDAPAECVLWLDSGACVLRPAPEIFEIIAELGYFALPNYQPLQREASEQACEGCGVAPEFRVNKPSLAANVFGFRRGSEAAKVVAEALRIAHTERFIRATKPWHRHDQALLGLLMHRDIHPLVLCDGILYAWDDLHADFTVHAIWAVRRGMHYKDKRLFIACLDGDVSSYRPRPSHKLALWYRAAWQLKVLADSVTGLVRGRTTALDGVKD